MQKLKLLILFLSILMSPPLNAEEEAKNFTLGFTKGVALSKFNSIPTGFGENHLEPPVVTLNFSYDPEYDTFVQPKIDFAVSMLNGSGQQIYMQPGMFFIWPKLEAFFGFETFATLSGGDYRKTMFDYWGYGLFAKGWIPLKSWTPSLEIRGRQLLEADLGSTEGLTTKIAHKVDYIFRPAAEIDLEVVRILLMYTYYQAGNTSIASKDFGTGIDSKGFSIISMGIGFDVDDFEVWVKGHSINDVSDEIAHYYSVPQVYPDFLIARESLFLELRWRF